MKIVALSDTHGHLPPVGDIPACDLMVIAGDISPSSAIDFETVYEFYRTKMKRWLEEVPAARIVAVAGNHDFFLHHRMNHARMGLRWDYLEDEMITVGGLRIWGSPWTPRLMGWAYGADESELLEIYRKIPAGIDILITHGPACGICDSPEEFPDRHHGSISLRTELERIGPRCHIFGHIHTGTHGGVRMKNGTAAYNVCLCGSWDWLSYPVTVIDI